MKKIILSVLVFMVLLFGFFNIKNRVGVMQEAVYHDNEKIASIVDSYTYRNRQGKSINKKTKLSFKLTGMETLWAIKSDSYSTIEIEYLSNINSGDLKLVLISPEDEVFKIFEGSGNNRIKLPVKEWTNRIKIVGLEASGDISFEIFSTDDQRVILRN